MPTRKRQHAVINWYLSGSPVDPAFTIGVDVEQDQTLHHVREDQLRAEGTEIYVRLILDLEAVTELPLRTHQCSVYSIVSEH